MFIFIICFKGEVIEMGRIQDDDREGKESKRWKGTRIRDLEGARMHAGDAGGGEG